MNGRNGKNERQFWVVSPNVSGYYRTVDEWKEASVKLKAAFMGYPPKDKKPKRIGFKFAYEIKSGDIILIARRHRHQPDIVGFGIVHGRAKTRIRGFKSPGGRKFGSMRKLSPFLVRKHLPDSLDAMSVLGQTAALRKIRRSTHEQICKWLERQLSISHDSRGRHGTSKSPRKARIDSTQAMLAKMPRDNQLEYKVRRQSAVTSAKKLEAKLLKEYYDWLEKRGKTLETVTSGRLRCDGYETQRGNLIEAKSRADREYIRMAVGQLFDYAFLGKSIRKRQNLAILLPNKPTTIDWLKPLKISVIWKQKTEFKDNAGGKFL